MKKLLLYFLIILFPISIWAQNQPDDKSELRNIYTELQKTAVTSEAQKKYQMGLFLELIKPLVYLDSLPERFTKYDSEYFTKNNVAAYDAWLAYNISLLNGLTESDSKQVPVRVDIDDSTILLNHEYLTINNRFIPIRRENNLIVIKLIDEFKPAIKEFKKINQQLIQEKSRSYLIKLVKVRQQYQDKLMLGYRDRNILSFFAEGYIQGKVNRKTHKNDNLLTPPCRFALIALAPPIIALSSNSINNIQSNSSFYSLVPVLGCDWYFIEDDYKTYIGAALFHASPLNDNSGLFDNSMAGVEVHYKNKFNIGYAISYKEIQNERISKVFISYALFSRFLKNKP
jgi:hypothetical protein